MLEVMQRINETAQGISLIVDSEGRLVDNYGWRLTSGGTMASIYVDLFPSCGQSPQSTHDAGLHRWLSWHESCGNQAASYPARG
jgi:hypothetical protein